MVVVEEAPPARGRDRKLGAAAGAEARRSRERTVSALQLASHCASRPLLRLGKILEAHVAKADGDDDLPLLVR
jgi:hypothetical protein